MRCVLAFVLILGVPAMLLAPRGEADAPPRPPKQGTPWTPPETKLPRFFLSATSALFEQGLADPRGCEYREIRLEADRDPAPDPRAGRPAMHGWVLPEGPKGGPRRAVGWDGLIHPLVSVGAEADVEADVRAMTAAVEGRAGFPRREFPGERTRVSQEGPRAMKVVMLLRLGRADLAERVWSAGIGGDRDGPGGGELASHGVSYVTLALDWAWGLFDRALTAHARGDDPTALASLRELARIRPLIESKARAFGRPLREADRGPGAPGQPQEFDGPSDPGFLKAVPALLADQERRAGEPKRPADPKRIADRGARIAALIRDFDRIHVESFSSFGRATPGSGDVVQAVVREGDAAVGPLLECLERDDRLTRTVNRDNRTGSRYVSIAGVDESAFAALAQILGTREFGPRSRSYFSGIGDREKRRLVAAEIRDYWEKNRGASPAERWYRTLADDSATVEQWMDAAEALSQGTNVQGRGGAYTIMPVPGGGPAPLRGEPLRGIKTPSITELMARRVRAMDKSTETVRTKVRADGAVITERNGHTPALFAIVPANRMAFFLARWDPKGALPTLREQFAHGAQFKGLPNNGTTRNDGIEADLARMTLLRLEAGDAEGLDDYAAWLRTADPRGYRIPPAEMFEPMWRHPDHPAVAAAALALFEDPESPWVAAFLDRDHDPQWAWNRNALAGIMTSPLLGVAPFRKLVLTCLEDRGEAGTVATDAAGEFTIVTKSGSWSPRPKEDPLRPKPSTRMTLSRADFWCSALSGLAGMPRLELYWPDAERDRVIAASAALLRQYGERFRFNGATRPKDTFFTYDPFDRSRRLATLSFPPLDRRATAEDVKAGRAIFALEGEARPWPLPHRPMIARWTALKIDTDDPRMSGQPVTPDRPSWQMKMVQGGVVWQAEETREGGRWRRSYGFVGHHALKKVPAEEIEFPAPNGRYWQEFTDALDIRILPPGVIDGSNMSQTPLPPGEPLPVEVGLRNRKGVDCSVQADVLRTEPRLTLRDGVAIRLFRRPDEAPAHPRPAVATPALSRSMGGRAPNQAPAAEPAWDEIPARPASRFRGDEATRTLAPAEAILVGKFDLRDLFAIDRPGDYRLEATFDDLKGSDGRPAKAVTAFGIANSAKTE